MFGPHGGIVPRTACGVLWGAGGHQADEPKGEKGHVMQPTWTEGGVIYLPGALPSDRWKQLAAEAVEAAPNAQPYIRDRVTSNRDGSFAAPTHCHLAAGGSALQELLYDRELLTTLREATGLPRLIPFGCAYVIYRPGDFQGLHTDSIKSTLTIGIALTELPPMGWAPHLRAVLPDELAEVVAEYGMFPSGDDFATLGHPLDSGDLQGFAGYDIPHWRPPYDGPAPAILATCSYMDL
jgi:hypothetical protein